MLFAVLEWLQKTLQYAHTGWLAGCLAGYRIGYGCPSLSAGDALDSGVFDLTSKWPPRGTKIDPTVCRLNYCLPSLVWRRDLLLYHQKRQRRTLGPYRLRRRSSPLAPLQVELTGLVWRRLGVFAARRAMAMTCVLVRQQEIEQGLQSVQDWFASFAEPPLGPWMPGTSGRLQHCPVVVTFAVNSIFAACNPQSIFYNHPADCS